MRAYIMIVTLAVLATSALAYMTIPQDQTYDARDCAEDCSGYQAGYKWAEQHSLDDEDYCPEGNSESFHAGCMAYIQRELSLSR